MKPAVRKKILYLALILLFLLRYDFWNWNRGDIVLGLPVSLVYHLLICIAASVLLFLLTRLAWPHLSQPDQDEDSR